MICVGFQGFQVPPGDPGEPERRPGTANDSGWREYGDGVLALLQDSARILEGYSGIFEAWRLALDMIDC